MNTIIDTYTVNLSNMSKRIANINTSHAGLYSIPWKDCDKYYIGETQCNLVKMIYKHKRSIKLNYDRKALFSHMSYLKYAFNFFLATLIKPIHCKKKISSAVIICSHLQVYTLNNGLASTWFHPTWQTFFYKRIILK